MPLTVAFTVSSQRQKYLRRCLDSWAAVRGVQDWHLLFCLEPLRVHARHGGPAGELREVPGATSFPVAEFEGYLRRSFRSFEVRVNEVRKGCSRNTRDTVDLAFAGGAEYVLLCEEDLEVSTDILEFHLWAQRYRDDPVVQAVCSHVFKTAALPHQAVRTGWFSPLGWGTWPDRWQQFIRPGWGGVAGNTEGWDANLRDLIVTNGQACVFPAWSRTEHFGEISTLTALPLAEYFYKQSTSACWLADYPVMAYEEVPRTEKLGLTV